MDKDGKVVDPVIHSVGSELGRYQFLLCMLIFLSKFPSGFVQISHVLLAYPIQTICEGGNSTDACDESCVSQSFDDSVFEENIISEWQLVCDNKYLASLSQTILMIGIMLGGIVLGNLGDVYGRRWTFVASCLLNLLSGVGVSFSPYFWVYCVLRFILGFATGGMMVISIVIIMECIGKKHREVMSILYQIPFVIGHASLPLFAYFLRHWRYFHFGFSIVSIIYIIYFWTVPESPRWLIAKARTEEAIVVLEMMAARNKKPTEHIRSTIESGQKPTTSAEPSAGTKKHTIIDLFKTRYICIKTCVMAFDWLTICLTYYGVAQYVTSLSGDIFLNVAIGGLLGIPGTIICVPMTKYLGRKPTFIISNAISAIGLLLIAFTPKYVHIYLATIAQLGASITFPNVYLYGAEIFPTVLRNTGVGFCSFIGRVGSMSAPFVQDLADISDSIPPIVYGSVCAIALILTFFLLPETKGTQLPQTVEEVESIGLKAKNEAKT